MRRSTLTATYRTRYETRTIYASGNVQLTANGRLRSALYAVASTYPGIGSYFLFASQPRHNFQHAIVAVVNDTVAGDYPLDRSCDIASSANGRCALLVLAVRPHGAFATVEEYYGHEGAITLARVGNRIRGSFSGMVYRDSPEDVGYDPDSGIPITDGAFDLPVLPQEQLGPLMSVSAE